MSAESPGSVFEVVDISNDEHYWPLGVFPSLHAALCALDGMDPDGLPIERSSEDYCRIEIRERAYGWSEEGRRVAVIEWDKKYNEADKVCGWYRSCPTPENTAP
jgi:hypothetical protein